MLVNKKIIFTSKDTGHVSYPVMGLSSVGVKVIRASTGITARTMAGGIRGSSTIAPTTVMPTPAVVAPHILIPEMVRFACLRVAILLAAYGRSSWAASKSEGMSGVASMLMIVASSSV